MMMMRRRSQCTCTWEAFVQRAPDVGLDGVFVKLLRNNGES